MRITIIAILGCSLFASCSSIRKSANQQKQQIEKSSFSEKDSTGSISIDTSSKMVSISTSTILTDSGYDKVIEEEIKEIIDSTVIHRETKRTIKEKGQKRTEQSSATIQKDSSGKQVMEQAAIKQLQKQDSSAFIATKNKEVKRIILLPWWLWLIAAGVVLLVWVKRNSIIDFFI